MSRLLGALGLGGKPDASDPRVRLSQAMDSATDTPAQLPELERSSAKRMAKYLWENYQEGLRLRQRHMFAWMKVKAIMSGLHYVRIGSTGTVEILRKKEGELRAVAPLMEPLYKWELGRLNSNQPGVSSTPKLGAGPEAFYKSDRAMAIMSNWTDEIDLASFFDRANQSLLYYGLVAYYRWIDRVARQVRLTPVPGPELIPVPYYATSFDEMDGIQRIQLVSEEWLETQDEARARELNDPGLPKMARKAAGQSLSMSGSFAGLASHHVFGGSFNGAVLINTWMKPNSVNSSGEWSLMVEEELFSYRTGKDENGRPKAMPHGLPLEPVYYTKKPDDFWGNGLCEQLTGPQQEMNRQYTYLLKWIMKNKPLTAFDANAVNINDITSTESTLIPMSRLGYEAAGRIPLAHFPAQPISGDVGAVLGLVQTLARRAAGMESDVIFGQAEGRTEGGPATSIQERNANTPLQPVVDRQWRAFQNTYPHVLDMLHEVWPESKIVRSAGHLNLGREIAIKKEQMPVSTDVILTPTPMVAGGRNSILQLLFTLRGMPDDDGKSALIKGREIRRALRMMNVNPPGVDIADEKEERIRSRIGLLINDGMEPAVPHAGTGQAPWLIAEDHRDAVDILKEHILGPGFMHYSQKVQLALIGEMDFHRNLLAGPDGNVRQPDKFDDDIEQDDAMRGERVLEAEENDMMTTTGQLSIDGVPIGLAS